MKKKFILNGNKFDTLEGFYDEVGRILCPGFKWGRNLDAFNDILRGGFGAFEYNESIELIWKNSSKSKSDLGYKETVRQLRKRFVVSLLNLSFSNLTKLKEDMNQAKSCKGPTVFEQLLEILEENKNVHLSLD